jgi:dTMP kinase
MVRLLQEGTTLVVDRYAYSGVAFSAAKVPGPWPGPPRARVVGVRLTCRFARQGLDPAWCRAPDAGLPAPDAVVYLHLSVDDAAQRGDYGAERYERRDFQAKVQAEFARLREPAWHWLDARPSVAEVHAQVLRVALDAIATAAHAPLLPLSTPPQA